MAGGRDRSGRAAGEWLVYCLDTTPCAIKTAEPAAAECNVELFCSGTCNGQAEHDAFQIAHQAARKAAKNKPVRRATSRRRRACVTGGNCSSHTGVDCGGYDCDAN